MHSEVLLPILESLHLRKQIYTIELESKTDIKNFVWVGGLPSERDKEEILLEEKKEKEKTGDGWTSFIKMPRAQGTNKKKGFRFPSPKGDNLLKLFIKLLFTAPKEISYKYLLLIAGFFLL